MLCIGAALYMTAAADAAAAAVAATPADSPAAQH